jgi:hypothetical protein
LKNADLELTVIVRDGRVDATLAEVQASGVMGPLAPAAADEALARLVEAPPQPLFGPDRQTRDDDQTLVAGLGTGLAASLLGDPAFRVLRLRLQEDRPVRVRIVSDDPQVLGAPWELLSFGTGSDGWMCAEHCEILRVPLSARPDVVDAPSARVMARHASELRVAIISPRPAGPRDVPVQPTLGPVLGTTLAFPGSVQLTVVRPRTLASLEQVIAENGPFDIVHFDGHGQTAAAGTVLLFEDGAGGEDPVDSDAFAEVVGAADPRLILLNACRSASTVANSPAPSLAAVLCQRLPHASVVAMRYAISVDFAEAVISSFYPLLVEGASVGEATRLINGRLAHEWRVGGSRDAAPLFVNLTVWASSSFAGDPPVAAGFKAQSIDWRRAAPALFWADEIEVLDRALDANRQIEVAGTIGSATSVVVDLFAEYARATRTFERVMFGLDADALAAPEGTLHVVVADPQADRAAAIAACAGLLDGKPRSAGIVVVTDGSTRPDVLHVGDEAIPIDLISARMRPILEGRDLLTDARAWELIAVCQDDFATLEALSACSGFEPAVELVERLRWGNDLDGFAHAELLRGALATLSEEQANLVSLLGLAGGGLVYQELLLLLTSGGIKDMSFINALGREVDAEEWDDALRAAASSGLLRLLDGLAPKQPALVTPLQALCLRERLVTWAGDRVSRLQRALALGAIGFSAGWDAVFRRSAGIHDSFLAGNDGLLARAVEFALREGDDDFAAHALVGLLNRPMRSLGRQGGLMRTCEALAVIYPVDRLHEFTASLHAFRAHDAMDRELWSSALSHAEAALAVKPARWKYMAEADVEIMRSRALWRTARTAEAEAALAAAAGSAGRAETRAAVAHACADFAQFRGLNAEQAEQLRKRVGAPREGASSMRKAIEAENDRRYGDAFELWVANLQERQLSGTASSRAFALEELGRFCAVYGSHEDALYWLRRRLEVGAELGLDPEAPLRYLGLSAERAGKLDEASSWLSDAIAAAHASVNERAEAECLYELALVAAQCDNEGTGAGRTELHAAIELFDRVGLPLHTGDCWLLIAQVEARADNMPAAWEAADNMVALYRAHTAGPERLAGADQVLVSLRDHG